MLTCITKTNVLQMEDYDHDPNHAYILVRIFNITRRPKVAFFLNPSELMQTGVLHRGKLEVGPDGYRRYPVDIKPGSWTAVEL